MINEKYFTRMTQALAKNAKKKGICKEWHGRILNSRTNDALIGLYLDGIDFCLANDYPAVDFIEANFSRQKLEANGIYVNGRINAENVAKIVCLGDTRGNIKVDDYNTAEIYVKHDSEIGIVARGNAFVMVDVFDNAKVMVSAGDNAKVCVNRYGNAVVHPVEDGSGCRIKVINKQKTTY